MARRAKKTRSKETVSGPRDYVAIALGYAQGAIADRDGKRFGKWMRLAARRFVADLDRAKKTGAPFKFDEWHANDACSFIENLPHVEGTWATDNIVMHPSHVFATVNLFGFRKPDGTRRFTTALYAVARKNAKSTWAAAVLLYCETCEGERGPQVITAATTGQQARVVFNIAKRMAERSSDFREAFNAEPFANAIACYSNGGTFKPINAKASTQDGLNPSAVCLDELHAHKTHDLLNVLKSAAGARRNPLFLYTTTEGYESPGPWAEERKFAKQVLEGVVEADHYFAMLYALDDEDDEFNEAAWVKANPLIEVNPLLLTEIRKEAVEAKQMPGRLAEFRIKRLNRQSSTVRGWVRFDKWKACGLPVDLERLAQYPCWGGLDLANTTDLCSFRLLWLVDGVYYTWGRRWVPEGAVAQRTIRGTVPYATWAASGALEQTPGDVIDHDIILAALVEACGKFKVQAIGYDSWNAAQIVAKAGDAGLPMVQVIQGGKTYNPAMKEFERAYIAGKFAHGGDPVLTWCASNIVVRHDANLNMSPDKKKSADKIDDMVALLECFVMAAGQKEESSFWEKEAS